MTRRGILIGAAAGAGAALLLLLLVFLTVVYSGAFNVSALEGHSPFVRWAFSTAMQNSVEGRADDVAGSPEFTPQMVEAGAGEYKAMCQHCHGGPGVERAEWAEGILPRPPYLTEAATEWSPREIFWIVQNGVKMSGMPAFGATHGEDAVWNIAAFVEQLPAMTAEQYRAFPAGHGHGGSAGETHAH